MHLCAPLTHNATAARAALENMVAAFADAGHYIDASELPFEQRLVLLVHRDDDWRDSKRRDCLLRTARLKVVSTAYLDDIDWRINHGLTRISWALWPSSHQEQ